jgi:hypothetical protein
VVAVWTLLFASSGVGLSGHCAVQEGSDSHREAISTETGRNKRLDQETVVEDTHANDSWVGQLFLPWSRQQSLPGGGTTRPEKATTVAVCQAQSALAGNEAVSRSLDDVLLSIRLNTWTRSLPWANS